MIQPATDGHIPHINGTNGVSAKPKRAPRYTSDAESANLYVLFLETGRCPARAKRDALHPYWSELFLRVTNNKGPEAEEEALEWIDRKDREKGEEGEQKGRAIRQAIAAARAQPSTDEARQAALDEELSKRPRTDMGNAERLVARRGVDFKHVEKWKSFTGWDGRRWLIGNEAAVMRAAKYTARRMANELDCITRDDMREAHAKWMKSTENYSRLKAMIATAKSDAEVSVEGEPMEAFDRHPFYFNTLNCTIDLRTGQTHQHRRSDMLTQLAPVNYDPKAECPHWLKTMHLVFNGNTQIIDFWQRLCGYCLTGSVAEQNLPIAWGDGENGKSTVLNVLMGFMGPDYSTKAPQNFLMVKRQEQHPTELADLYGKRLIVAIETGEGARINETLIKELTGSDIIKARRLYEDSWRFSPTHKVMLCTNHDPVVKGTDHAIWRRLLKIPFTTKITGDARDKRMPEKLEAEYPGILNWCLAGCLKWQAEGELLIPQDVADATAAYRDEQDKVAQFFTDRCNVDSKNPEMKVRANVLYAAYRSWSEHSGEHPLSQTAFGLRIRKKGIKKDTSNGTWYRGIDLRQETASVDHDRDDYF